MDALNVGSEDISALVDPDNASRSAASYHYVVLDNTVASGVDNTTGKLYGIEFFYNDVDNHFMVETATGKTYEITFEWTELTSTLWFTIAGDATTSRTSIASSIPAAAAGYDIDYAFNITVAGQTLAGTLQIPTGKRADTFSQAYVSFTGAPSGYTMYNASSPIAELQYRTFSGVNPVVYTNKAQITSISHGASPAFQIMVNSVQISATWPALPATGYDASQIQLVAQTSSYEVINAGDYLFAKAANAMRIALVHQTFANPDNVGAGTAKTYSGADVMIYDPYSNSGWSYYDNMNMAHEAYMGEMAGILLEPNYNATHNGVGRDAVTHTYNSTARTATGAYTNGTYTANNPTFLLKDTGVLTNGENVYGAKVSLYIWIEGTDADCMNAIAAYYILGQLSFTGAMPR